MNDILIELCERKSYEKTKKMLEKAKGKCGMLQRLDNFIKSLKEASGKEEENAKPKSKLSFDVSKLDVIFFQYRTSDQYR